MNKFNWMIARRFLDLQLFADAPEPTGGEPGGDPKGTDPKPAEPKYSEDDLKRIIGQVLDERDQKKKEADDEAEKLKGMNDKQKAEHERDKIQKELDEYKRKDALAEMSKTARKMLADQGITVPDELLALMVTTEAEQTKTAIDSFAKLFQETVESAVKQRLRGEPPKKGSGGGTNVSEIQKRINKYS